MSAAPPFYARLTEMPPSLCLPTPVRARPTPHDIPLESQTKLLSFEPELRKGKSLIINLISVTIRSAALTAICGLYAISFPAHEHSLWTMAITLLVRVSLHIHAILPELGSVCRFLLFTQTL